MSIKLHILDELYGVSGAGGTHQYWTLEEDPRNGQCERQLQWGYVALSKKSVKKV